MINSQHIFLCGFMGCGKSTHGRKLARLLKCKFIDLDKQIETTTGKSIPDIFAEQGETAFRNLETKELQETINTSTSSVVSLGGGTPCFNDNIKTILHNGILIYIQMDEKSLYQRVVRSKKNRPLLQDKTREELLLYIKELVEQREPYYLQAHITLKGINLKTEEIVESILSYKEKKQ